MHLFINVSAANLRAVEEGVIEDKHAFRHVYTGIEKTVKRALPLSMIKKIKELDLSQNRKAQYARDKFMLSLNVIEDFRWKPW